MSKRMRPPSTKELKKFIIPHGVYTQTTGIINRKLQKVYRRYRRGTITKAQTRKEGTRIITESKFELMKIVWRWFHKNGLTPIEPETTIELDFFIRGKIQQWGWIVDDM